MQSKQICLQPLGYNGHPLLQMLSDGVQNVFGYPVSILSSLPVPASAYDPDRQQYSSRSILGYLADSVPSGALRVLGVTDVDLFVPAMNYVFGEAAVNGTVCVVSLCRLHPEFYGEQPNPQLFVDRTIKEAVHELGHTFGLHHCTHPECVMFFSSDIRTTDQKSKHFCEEHARQLRLFPGLHTAA